MKVFRVWKIKMDFQVDCEKEKRLEREAGTQTNGEAHQLWL